LTLGPAPVHTPFYTPNQSPTPSSQEERSLSPVIFASFSPSHTPSPEPHTVGTGTHSNPICLDDADPSSPLHSNPNPPSPTPSRSLRSSRSSSSSSSSYRFEPYRRYTHTYTFRHEVIHQQALTNDQLEQLRNRLVLLSDRADIHDNAFNQVLDHLETIQNSLLLIENITTVTPPTTSEASTQTETILPPPIARTTPRTIPPTTYRNVTVVHHLIDDRTNNEIDERTIHASSVRVYRRPNEDQLHRIDVRERIISRPRQETQ
jgi:hypothetical protein